MYHKGRPNDLYSNVLSRKQSLVDAVKRCEKDWKGTFVKGLARSCKILQEWTNCRRLGQQIRRFLVTKPVEEFAGQLWTAWYEEFANRVPGLAIKIAKSYKRQLGFQVFQVQIYPNPSLAFRWPVHWRCRRTAPSPVLCSSQVTQHLSIRLSPSNGLPT